VTPDLYLISWRRTPASYLLSFGRYLPADLVATLEERGPFTPETVAWSERGGVAVRNTPLTFLCRLTPDAARKYDDNMSWSCLRKADAEETALYESMVLALELGDIKCEQT